MGFLALGDADGRILPREHGGVRLMFPQLYGWKSAKYLTRIEFCVTQRRGFWERLGCHRRGRWEFEERWADGAVGVWNVLAWLTNRWQLFGENAWVRVMQTG